MGHSHLLWQWDLWQSHGEVTLTDSRRVCHDMGLRGFPTDGQLYFFESLPGLLMAGCVALGQMQLLRKLLRSCSCLGRHADFHTRKLHRFRLFSPDGKLWSFIKAHLLYSHKPELCEKLIYLASYRLFGRYLFLSASRVHLLVNSSWFHVEIGDCNLPPPVLHPSWEKFYKPR